MLIVAAVLSAEVPDTSGEILVVRGADISALKTGTAPVNTEHHNPEDLKSIEKDFGGFNTIIGRVITAKKIFSAEDCENEYELEAWNKLQVPLIFGYVEFFDGDDAHDNAKAAASLIRMNMNRRMDYMIGFSVEGQILKREGDKLTETVIKRIAATAKPANKAATIQAVVYNEPNKFLEKSELNQVFKELPCYVIPNYNFKSPTEAISLLKVEYSLNSLKKTLSAGGVGSTSPSNLSDGSVLQKEFDKTEVLKNFLEKMKDKKVTPELIKKYFPQLSLSKAEKLCKIVQQYKLHLYEEEAKKAYNALKKIMV